MSKHSGRAGTIQKPSSKRAKSAKTDRGSAPPSVPAEPIDVPSTALASPGMPESPGGDPAGFSMNPNTALSLSAREDRIAQERREFEEREADKLAATPRPSRTKMRKTVAEIIALRLAGLNDEQIGKKVGLAPRAVRQYVYRGTKAGWVTFDDPDEDLEFRLKHKIIRNVEGVLDGTLLPSNAMQEMTIAAAKGTGLFKGNEQKQTVTLPQMAIQVNIVGAPGTAMAIPGQTAREEAYGGTPAYLEASVSPAADDTK